MRIVMIVIVMIVIKVFDWEGASRLILYISIKYLYIVCGLSASEIA